METVGTTMLQFQYGAIEQLVRAFIANGKDPGNADILKLADNGADKAFDFLQDNIKGGIQEEIKNERDQPSADLQSISRCSAALR